MPATSEKHTEVILHECSVVSIIEDADQITLHLNVATLSPDHPSNSTKEFLDLRPVELRLDSVKSSTVNLWSESDRKFELQGARLPLGLKEIYEPERPVVEQDGSLLWIINGFDAESGRWLEWRVLFGRFILSWQYEEKRNSA